MATWKRRNLSGFDGSWREIAGEVRGEFGGPAGFWVFWDGIETHVLRKRHVRWNAARGIMTIPSWLAMRTYARARHRIRNRYLPRYPSSTIEE